MDETTSELIGELLQSLTKDVDAIRKEMTKPGAAPPVDYGPRLDALTKAVEALPDRLKQSTATPDQSAIIERLKRLEHLSRQHPDRQASQYVQIGALATGLMVLLLGLMTWRALSWEDERDSYARNYTWANWRLRYLKQAEPEYYQLIEGKFTKDAAGTSQWIEEQEQADATREAARKAAEQAAALTKQANRLEGPKRKPNS